MEREAIKNSLTNADFSDVQSETLSHLIAGMATRDEMRNEFRSMREEMRSEFRSLRNEMKLFRDEVQSEFRAIRTEMQSEFRAVRTEMHGEFRAVRDEMKVMRSDISKEISDSAKETQARLYTSMVMLIVGLAAIFTALDIFID